MMIVRKMMNYKDIYCISTYLHHRYCILIVNKAPIYNAYFNENLPISPHGNRYYAMCRYIHISNIWKQSSLIILPISSLKQIDTITFISEHINTDIYSKFWLRQQPFKTNFKPCYVIFYLHVENTFIILKSKLTNFTS